MNLKTKIVEYKRTHPNEGCKIDCQSCVKCGDQFYCSVHQTRFTSPDDIMCIQYHPDRLKEIPEKTDAMRLIDQIETEDEVHHWKKKEDQNQLEEQLKRHAIQCPEFRIIFDHLYRTFQYDNGITDGSQLMRSYFHYCPACKKDFMEMEE